MSDAAPSHLHWGAEALWRQLSPLLPGLSVEVVARSMSTNSELLERARLAPSPRASRFGALDEAPPPRGAGRRHDDARPCLLVAEEQLGGRGRLGRGWRSAAGTSLTFSLALPLAPADWSGLSLAVGVALAEALQPAAPDGGPPRLMVKWPNDLWLVDDAAGAGAPSGRKLGGVLIETLAVGARRLAVVGVGLNVAPLPAALAAELAGGAACMREIDAGATPPDTLARVALPLLAALREFERDGYAAFAARFAARDLLRGRAVVTTHPAVPEGVARGTDARGALRVEAPDGWHALDSGDVSVRPRPATAGPRAAPPDAARGG